MYVNISSSFFLWEEGTQMYPYSTLCTKLSCTVWLRLEGGIQALTCVLFCTVLFCTVLYRTVLNYTVLYCTVLYCTVLYCTVLYYTVINCKVLYCTVLYCTVLYCTVLYCLIKAGRRNPTTTLCTALLYCTVLHYCTALYCTDCMYCVLYCTVWLRLEGGLQALPCRLSAPPACVHRWTEVRILF